MSVGLKHIISHRTVETHAILLMCAWGIAIGLGVGVTLLVQNKDVVLFGSGLSLSIILAIVATISAVVGFVAGYPYSMLYHHQPHTILNKFRKYMSVFALVFVYASIAYLLVTAVLYAITLRLNSINLPIPSVLTIILAIGLSMLIVYIVFLQAVHLSTLRLVSVLTVFMFCGGLTSALTSEDQTWWQFHFSQLGSGEVGIVASSAFNLTLICAGLMIALLADFILYDLRRIQEAAIYDSVIHASIVRTLFITIGIGLMGVGLIPVDRILLVHNMFANLSSSTFGIMLIALPWLIPILPRIFIVISYVFVFAIAGAYWLTSQAIINLVALELMGALLFLAWLALFIRQIDALYRDINASTSR